MKPGYITIVEVQLSMETAELKTKFHHLINHIGDTTVLSKFYRALEPYHGRMEPRDIIDDLSDDELNRLDESLRQCESGQCTPHEIVKSEINKWLSK
ncbi:MAG: hypothetical protein GY765_30490 [bacterium]|nr:hypothetical protein [bacterium]